MVAADSPHRRPFLRCVLRGTWPVAFYVNGPCVRISKPLRHQAMRTTAKHFNSLPRSPILQAEGAKRDDVGDRLVLRQHPFDPVPRGLRLRDAKLPMVTTESRNAMFGFGNPRRLQPFVQDAIIQSTFA